jgi:hypothetical protein
MNKSDIDGISNFDFARALKLFLTRRFYEAKDACSAYFRLTPLLSSTSDRHFSVSPEIWIPFDDWMLLYLQVLCELEMESKKGEGIAEQLDGWANDLNQLYDRAGVAMSPQVIEGLYGLCAFEPFSSC